MHSILASDCDTLHDEVVRSCCYRDVDALPDEEGKALKKAVVDHLMSFMGSFTSRPNLTSRLGGLWTEAQAQFNVTQKDILREINEQLAGGELACHCRALKGGKRLCSRTMLLRESQT